MAEEFINDTEQTEDPFASFGGKAIKPAKTDDNPFKAFGGDAVTKKPSGNGSKNTSLPSATGGLLDPNFLQNTNSGNASFSPIADPKERQRVKDNAAHSMAIQRAQDTKATSVPRDPQLSATEPKNTSIFDDISEALYIPAINKGFSDLVIKPAAGATDFIDRTIDKTYQAITGEKTPEFLRKKGAFHKLSEWVDKGFEERKKPTNIVSETAEGVVGTLPLIASLYTGQGELNIMAKAPQFFSKATKMLATTHGLNAFKDATDNGDDYTTSLGKATTGALQGGLTGMTIEAEMMVGGALGKGVAKQLAEKGLFKGGKAGEAILHALGVGTVFAGTSAGEDLLNGRDVDSHEAIKQFFTGLAFEAIPVGKALKDEVGERIEKSDINKNAAQTATLATASSNLNAESVMRTLVQTPKDQLLAINENIKDNHETLYANSIEQGARAYEEKNVNEKRALYADQLALKTQGDVKLIVDKLKDGGEELIKSIEESEELSQEQKIDLIDKIQDLSPKPIEEQVVQEAPVAEQNEIAGTENIEPQAETQPITNEQPIESTVPEAEVLSEQTQPTTEPQISETAVESGAEPKITVNEILDKPITYKGEPAILTQDGQSLVVKIKGSNREYELGNVDEVGEQSIKENDIEHENSVVNIAENGNLTVRGKEVVNNYSDPKQAINYDKEGNIISVSLETTEGKKRTFKGDVAEDIAYQIHLKELNNNNETREQFEQFVEQHEPSRETVVARENEIIAEKGTVEDNATVSRKPAKKITPKPVEAKEPTSVADKPKPVGKATPKETVPTKENPEPKAEVNPVDTKAGDPLRQFASKVREGKISKLGGFKTGSLFDTAWDGSLEVVATSLEGGAKLADAIEAGLKHIRETEFYKGLQEKKDFEQQYVSHMEKEAATEPVIEPTKEKSNVSGSRHESTAEIREELGMDEYERITKSQAALSKQADEAMEKGYEINKLLDKMDKGTLPSDVEQVIMRKYIVSLQANIDASPTPENIAKLKRAIDLSDKVGGTELARSLAARQGTIVKEDNLANFLLDEINASGTDLTKEEISQLKPKYQKGTEARKKYEAGVEATQKKAQPDKAEKELGTIRDSVKKERVRKTADEFRTERQEAIKRMRADLLKAAKGGYGAMSSIPLAPQLRAIAPHIATLVRSHVEEGFYELSDVVKRVHDDLKDIVDGITETDVRDLIAGEYRDKRATRNEITAQIHDLTTQAKLTKRLEDIETGLNPKTPEGKIAKSKQVEELKKQIKLAEDEAGITDQKSLKARQTYLKNQIEKLKKDLADGNFDKEPEPIKKLKLDEETEKYLDEYIAFQKETNLRRDKARYDRMNKAQKAWDITQQVLGLRRLVQTSIDMSMPFRQAVTVTLNPRHAAVTVKAFKNMFANTFNEKRYDRMMFDIENSPNYKAMVEDKVRFSTVENINNHDEDFRRSFAYKIPIVREPLMASERAATSFINTARYELYNKAKMRFEAQGLTRENSPETYTEMAKWVNNITGRGNLIKFLEESPQAQQILGNTFYGSRLMASRFNLLNPAYYVRMPRAVAIEAMKDMGAYASTLFVTGLALQAAGANITLNWNDPDFMKAKFGNTRYDLTGGMAQYIRTYMRILEAVENRVDPTVSKDQANKSGKFAATSLQQFFRFKLAPNTSYAVDAVTGKNAMGQDFDPYGLIRIYPMYADDMKKAWQDQGVTSLATILAPSIFGVGVQTYEPRTKWK